MPSAVVTTLPAYLSEVLTIAKRLESENPSGESEGAWFRGSNDRNHGLQPGACWRKNVDEPALVVEFMAQAPPYLELGSYRKAPESLWEWYFLMQHYGLPTRLLDWTESALVALFFALYPPGPRPCVWVLDPVQFNRQMISDPKVITPGGDFTKHWLPIAAEDQQHGCKMDEVTTFEFLAKTYTNEHPMAIYAPRRNVRIVAQQGTFTVHGSSKESLHKMLTPSSSMLACVEVDPTAQDSLLQALATCGVSELNLFPELERLAPHIKKRFQLNA